MATYETKGRLTYKDIDGNNHVIYPITKKDYVEGLDEFVRSKIAEAELSGDGDVVDLSNYVTKDDLPQITEDLKSYVDDAILGGVW